MPRLREISPTEHFVRVCAHNMKVRGYISTGTKQVHLSLAISGMIMILFAKPSGRYGLPLSGSVQALAVPDHRLAALQSFLYVALVLRSAEDHDLRLPNQLAARLRLLIKKLQIGFLRGLLPPHADTFLLHRFRLNKHKAPLQQPIHCIAKGNLMMIQIVGHHNTGLTQLRPPVV